jgi:muramoyltetrapeptide carboxypeptidase
VTEGRLIGGCLSLLASNLGTSFLPSLRGALLFLEDVHEEPPRLDRLFSQLRNGGVLRRLAGLLLGQFTDRGTRTGAPAHLPWPEMLGEVLAEVRGPALDNLPYGHVASRWTLPLGVRARLDATRKRVTLLEPTVC